jgi:hypothetical protein
MDGILLLDANLYYSWLLFCYFDWQNVETLAPMEDLGWYLLA